MPQAPWIERVFMKHHLCPNTEEVLLRHTNSQREYQNLSLTILREVRHTSICLGHKRQAASLDKPLLTDGLHVPIGSASLSSLWSIKYSTRWQTQARLGERNDHQLLNKTEVRGMPRQEQAIKIHVRPRIRERHSDINV